MRKCRHRTNLECVFVALALAELTNYAIELILAGERATLFLPFVDGHDGAAFWVDKAQKPAPKSVSPAAAGSGG